MGPVIGRMAAAILVIVVIVGPVSAEEARRVLTVRLYNGVGLPVADVTAAQAIAEPVLRAAGIDVAFRLCRMAEPASGVVDLCEGRLAPTEVIVRLIETPPEATVSPHAYGMAYVGPPLNQGSLATVFANRVTDGAARGRVDRRTLLGLVVAHEVGHLLLGEAHSPTGLMSAQWGDADFRREVSPAHAPTWRFSPSQSTEIQERLLER